MKKIFFCLVFFLICFPLISAITPTVDSLMLVGYAGNQCSLSISLDDTPLYKETGVWSFKMTDTRVQKLTGATLVNGTGFRFASWSLISNTNQIELIIDHDKLVNESDPNEFVDYALAVECSKIPYNTTAAYKYGIIFTEADGPQTVDFSQASNDPFVSVNNYGLFIRLDATEEDVNQLESGVYYSTIYMTVNSK